MHVYGKGHPLLDVANGEDAVTMVPKTEVPLGDIEGIKYIYPRPAG